MNYEVVNLEKKIVAGVCARSDNGPECPAIIGGLWQKFMGEGVAQSIKNTSSPCPVCVYSDYDDTSYDATVGMIVSSNDNKELMEKTIPAGKYAKFFIKGDVVKDVGDAWNKIWGMNLDRSFTADFEEYLSNDNGVAEVNIYVALK